MTPKTIAFFGASTGVGLSALQHSLSAGNICIALCRTPSKLTSKLPSSMKANPNLTILEGNAHSLPAVISCLKTTSNTLVDEIVFTIGAMPKIGRFGLPTMDDPHVCEHGMKTVLQAINQLRSEGVTGRPLIVAVSTIGLSKFGRDIAIPMIPVYAIFVGAPRVDKRIMEDSLIASGEDFAIVRASHLVDGATEKVVRVGREDPVKGVESLEIGYAISREDCGRWIAENLVLQRNEMLLGKISSITW
jgi:hypothetical protein